MKEFDMSKLTYNELEANNPTRIPIGIKVGKLYINKYLGSYYGDGGRKNYLYEAKCDCGNNCFAMESSLKGVLSGKRNSISCGCSKIENINSNRYTGKGIIKGKYSYDSKAVSHLHNMKQRCYNPNNKKYKNYGARGITICDEWMDKENGKDNFCDWMYREEGFTDDMGDKGVSIERIDRNKGYSPDNCTLSYNQAQSCNTKSTRETYWYGNKYSLKDLSSRYDKSDDRVRNLLREGKPLEEALLGPNFGTGQKSLRQRMIDESPNGLVVTPQAFVQLPFKFVDHSEISTNDPLRNKEWPNETAAMNDYALARRIESRDAGHPVKPFQFTDGKSDDFLCSYVPPIIPMGHEFKDKTEEI